MSSDVRERATITSMDGTATVLRGNALTLPLAHPSVDLIVTSPPYFGLRSYQDGGKHYDGQIGAEPTPAEFVDALIAATREMVRVLKPSGSIWVNLGDKYARTGGVDRKARSEPGSGDVGNRKAARQPQKAAPGIPEKSLVGIPWRYAIRCIDELGLILRAEVIWSKPNGLPESVTDRVRRSHETWFHFTKEPRYFSAIDEVREAYEWDYSKGYKMKGNSGTRKGNDTAALADPRRNMAEHRDIERGANPLGKLPGSVWTIPTQPLRLPEHLGVDHFAAFPMEWPRRIIQGWSPVGGLVLDPFGGTGTTATVAKALGRHGITLDMSGDYCQVARWRTNDEKQLAKAAQRAIKKRFNVSRPQEDLFS